MSVIQNFIKFFDKTTRQSLQNQSIGCCSIFEKNSVASLKTLSLKKANTTFYAFDELLTKSMSHITCDRSSFVCDKECDGVVFFEEDGVVNVCLADLKSKFSDDNLFKALNQVIVSFVKLYCMLSLCDGFDLCKMNVRFILACQNFESQEHKAAIVNKLDKLSMLFPRSPLCNLLRNFLSGQKTNEERDFYLKDFDLEGVNQKNKIENTVLSNVLKQCKIRLTLATTAINGNDVVIFNL